jgi:hypothetical protein
VKRIFDEPANLGGAGLRKAYLSHTVLGFDGMKVLLTTRGGDIASQLAKREIHDMTDQNKSVTDKSTSGSQSGQQNSQSGQQDKSQQGSTHQQGQKDQNSKENKGQEGQKTGKH